MWQRQIRRMLSNGNSQQIPKFERILLLGAPGVGKGTYARAIVKTFGHTHLCSGDIIRHHIQAKSTLGISMNPYYSRGELVPDEMIFELMIKKLDQTKKFVLDGFPRTEGQLEWLEKRLDEKSKSLEAALLLELPRDLLEAKMESRRICQLCGENYNVASLTDESRGVFLPPLLPRTDDGSCDRCGGPLFQRDDDRPEVVRRRLDLHENLFAPILQHFHNQTSAQSTASASGKVVSKATLIRVNVSRGRDATIPELIRLISSSSFSSSKPKNPSHS